MCLVRQHCVLLSTDIGFVTKVRVFLMVVLKLSLVFSFQWMEGLKKSVSNCKNVQKI